MNVDREKTKRYYEALDPEFLCSCDYCRLYAAKIRSSYPEVCQYLEQLGIDPQKPDETSPLEPDERGILTYCACQYLVFGTCPEDYSHQIGDVHFRLAHFYPSTGLLDPHFVLEFSPISLSFCD